MSADQPMAPTRRGLRARREWGVLLAILVGAAFLRLYRLGDVPPGLTHDEASNGHDAAAVLDGVHPIYFTVGYGHEPLYVYSVAAAMSVLGRTDSALRLTTVGWGLGLILLSYGLARRLFGSLPALLAAAWMATSFWCVMTSRVGLRAITLAAVFTASAYCFWRGLSAPSDPDSPASSRRRVWPILSGLFLGASIYTYMASRIMPAVYLLFLFYLLVLPLIGVRFGGDGRSCAFPRRRWVDIPVLLLVAALVALPLLHFLATHPEAEQRVGQLSAPLVQALQGDFSALWRNVSGTLPTFAFSGDPMWRYNIAGRPLLDPVSAVLFFSGVLLCLWRWRDPRYAFLSLWLAVGVAPALVAPPDGAVLRSIAAQPAIFITAALPLAAALDGLRSRVPSCGLAVGVGACVVIVVMLGLCTGHAYFSVWGTHREVRVTYYHALVQEVRYLDAQPEGGSVALSSIYPGRFHDPYTAEICLRREDLDLHWFDGRSALVFPAAGEARVIIPAIAPLDQTVTPLFEPYASLIHTGLLRADDLIPRFDVYRFDAERALDELLSTAGDNPVYWCSSGAPPAAAVQAACHPLLLPADVDGVVELAGYELHTPSVGPGGEVELLTVWRVRAPFALEAILFVHVLDAEERVVGQEDRLDVPSWHWRAGDAFVQVHRFAIEPDASPGLYRLEVGVYTREDTTRLPVSVDGVEVGDRVFLAPVEVVAP